MVKKRRCGSRDTATGNPCLDAFDSCPHPAHRQSSRPVPTPASTRPTNWEPSFALARPGGEQTVLPGVNAGAWGFAGEVAEFSEAAHRTTDALGIPLDAVVRDYWLTACLHGIATSKITELPIKIAPRSGHISSS